MYIKIITADTFYNTFIFHCCCSLDKKPTRSLEAVIHRWFQPNNQTPDNCRIIPNYFNKKLYYTEY